MKCLLIERGIIPRFSFSPSSDSRWVDTDALVRTLTRLCLACDTRTHVHGPGKWGPGEEEDKEEGEEDEEEER